MRLVGMVAIALCFVSLDSEAQVAGLSFRPLDAKYSTALDRIIFLSGSPNQLHIYNPVTKSDQVVALAEIPSSVAVSADGTKAAVAFADAVAYVDLQTASVKQTFSNLTVGSGTVTFGAGYIYVFPGGEGSMLSIQISTGQVTPGGELASGGVYDPSDAAVYTTDDAWSPNDIYRYDASGGALGAETQAPFWGIIPICGPLTLSHDGSRIYTSCGNVFQASSDATKDMHYAGSFPGLSHSTSLAISDSLQQIAAIPFVSPNAEPPEPNADTVVDLFSSSLNPVGQFSTTPFVVSGQNYPSHGRWVFYNANSSSMFVVTQADSSAALELDYAVETVDLTKQNSCNASFATTSTSAAATGGYATLQISSGEDCVFTVSSDAPWIALASGFYGSGNTTLTYLVRPNLTASSRSGTIVMGSQTFTVTQAAAGASSTQNPLSFKPVAADYDRALEQGGYG